MVAKIVSGKSVRGILTYNEDKVKQGSAKVILAGGFATDIDRLNFHQKLYRFEALTQLNARTKTNALHISLNFHADDRIDAIKLQQVTSQYMDGIGFGDQPYIAYEHFDAAHPHVHIATVIIDRTGQRMNIHDLGKRISEPIRKQLEIENGLIRAEGRRLRNKPYLRMAEYGVKPTKKMLADITRAVMRDYAYTSFAEYKAVLSRFNVHAERGAQDSVMFEKKGLLYSITDGSGNIVGVPFKASSFYQGATMKNLEKRFERNKERRKDKKEYLVRSIERVFAGYASLTSLTFQKELAAGQVAVVFRQNENGFIYGLTFIDHRNRTVFNGSDLGRGYGAKAITDRFALKDVAKVYLRKEAGIFRASHQDTGHSPGYEDNLLDVMLAKADYEDPSVIGRRKEKKKGTDQSRGV